MNESLDMAQILSVAELKQLRKPIRKPHEVHAASQSWSEKFAVWISTNVGSIGFFIVILIWTILWLGWNTLGPDELSFDPSPTFQTWVFVANVIQLILMPLILVGQNIQSRAAQIKENEEYELNIRQERELENVLLMLEKQNQLLESILQQQQKTN